MQTGNFRGFEVAIHDPGIAVVTFNQPERLNGMTPSGRSGRNQSIPRKASATV
jgi:hypothetical protein